MAMRALFAGLSVLHVAGAKTCSVVSGTHYVTGGHDVSKIKAGSSGDCAQACEANSECCVAEFDSNAKLCYLKYAGAVKGAAKGIYAVQCNPACGASPPSPPPTPKPSPAPPSPTPPVTPPPVTPPPPPPAPPGPGFGGACDCSPDGCPKLGPECTPKKVLWLPLGDSITWGCNGPTVQDCHNDSAGYRVPLALALSQHPLGATAGVGFDISTMGTLETGPPYVPRKWLKHEGHPGWRIYQIDALLNQSLATSATPPDLITIHLGTNDCLGGEKIPQMVGYMNSLLGHIYAAVPQAQVFLSDVIASGYKGWGDGQIPKFNKELPSMVDAWTAKGMKVFLVSAYDAMQPGCGAKTAADHDLCGGGQIHPTSAGYPRMASAFALSIMRNFKAP